MVVQHNLPAINANNQMTKNVSFATKSTEKLSSGFRINRAGDDAAGLAISEKMRGQIRGLNAATRNAQDGISLIQTAEGALQETHSILQRMRELAVQSANGVYEDDVDRENIQNEFDNLIAEIDRIGDSTKFNGISLIDGNLDGDGTGAALKFQVGANGNDFEIVELNVASMKSDAIGADDTDTIKSLENTGVSTQDAAKDALAVIDGAINAVSSQRGGLGALQNRLEYTINNLTATSENLTAAESRIRDTDMAKEMMEYTKYSILQQASQAMLAQANVQPQSVLQLLG